MNRNRFDPIPARHDSRNDFRHGCGNYFERAILQVT